jgi:hypothetical protein
MGNLRTNIKDYLFIVVIIMIAIIANGCNQDSVNQPSQADNMDFSSTSKIEQITQNNGGVLILTDVKLLLKDIKLNVAGSGDQTANFKSGPFVIHMDNSTILNTVTSAFIPVGTYDKVLFEIHKLADNENPPDPDFADMQGRYSIVARGTYNGNLFIFKSDVSAHQKLTFPKSLVVTSDGKSNITLQVTPYLWFLDDNGLILDPSLKSNLSIISRNIKENINENIKIFLDKDKNGEPD